MVEAEIAHKEIEIESVWLYRNDFSCIARHLNCKQTHVRPDVYYNIVLGNHQGAVYLPRIDVFVN